ncbi:retrovirus-related Pol polyprotein from transposon 17.6 [Trichonephila clavipes]|nr:retrovirus-related Pol polyprotein from transposon 17.6 [Trichonephila clavipes]
MVQAERDEKEENDYKRKQEGLSDFRTRTHEDLVLTDQLKKRVPKQVNEHFVDIWEDNKSSPELIQKLDDYEIARGKTSNHKFLPYVRRTSFHSKINKQIRTVDKAKEEPRKSFRRHSQFESRNPLSCYLCGKSGYIKSKCPDCNPSKGDPAHFGILRNSSLSPSNRNDVLRISLNGVSGTVFEGSGASHSIAGETLYTILLQQGAAFEKTVISLSFADGIVTQNKVLHTFQTVILEVPPYRMNPARKELLKKELDSLLQQGIIVECESPYTSPVVLISKPNGSMRLCIDYRYHQVKVEAEDQDKTAFTCPFSIYKFTRMPFGLQNVPATFQRPTSEQEKADCDILVFFVNFPTRSPKEVRQEQLKDDELKKITEYFENKKNEKV